MTQGPAITIDQLRNQEIAVTDLVSSATTGRDSAITAPGTPLSVFGRKLAGHSR